MLCHYLPEIKPKVMRFQGWRWIPCPLVISWHLWISNFEFMWNTISLHKFPFSSASLSITKSQSLLKLMSIELVMPSNHPIFCCPLLLPPSIFASIRVFSNELVLHIRWPKYWSFSISPSNEYSGLIFFRIDWFDLLAVQRTLKSFLQPHSSKASILQYFSFFMVQLSHPYGTTGKNISLPIQTLTAKWCLCFSTCCLGLL